MAHCHKLIRSLAESRNFLNTESASTEVVPLPVIKLVLGAIADDDVPTWLVETYSFNWWDNDKVTKISY